MVALRDADRVGGLGARFLQGHAFGLKRFECFARTLQVLIDLRAARGELLRESALRLDERLELGLQALAALGQRFRSALQVGAVRLLELQAALRLHDEAARLVQLFLARAEALLGLRQPCILGLDPLIGGGDALPGRSRARSPHVQRLGELR
ncbi:MAG TPA: hypothetical protein VMV01_08055, partial [Planctomycetota bacterium]|nr:hypothetical protein [Planctomycetota bacterium]